MKTNFKKLIALSLCAATLSLSTTPVFATSLKDMESKIEEPAIMVNGIQRNHVYIPEYTVLQCELITPASSKTNKVNDILTFKTSENLAINGVIVVPRGTIGQAIVTKASRAGMFGQGGKIEFAPRSIKTLNGIDVPLTLDLGGKGDNANMTLGILGLGVFSVFLGGKNVNIPTGTKFNTAIQCDIDLNCTNDELEKTMVPLKGDMLVTITD